MKQEAFDRLAEAVQSITNGEEFRRFLEFSRRFRAYSLHNVLMILHQRPNATHVAGYRTWQNMGRQVSRGEHGLAIFAPRFRKVERTEDKATEETRRVLAGFMLVHVFDVSQTFGEPIPEPPHPADLTAADASGIGDRLRTFAETEGVTVADGETGSAEAFYKPSAKSITLRPTLTGVERAHALAHEVAHHVLHAMGEDEVDKPTRETEAEAVAFLVMDAEGVDCGPSSFPYVAGWAENVERVSRSLTRIQRAADRITKAIQPAAETVAA